MTKQFDPEQARKLAAIGCTDREIAYVLGISEATLRRKCRKQIDAGRAELSMSLKRKQLEVAKNGSVAMLIWLGKQYLGQKDRQEIEHGSSIEVVEEVVFSNHDSVDTTAG